MKDRGDIPWYRRRCGWCAVRLRGWQLNLCRGCRAQVTHGPMVVPGSRIDAQPDAAPTLRIT